LCAPAGGGLLGGGLLGGGLLGGAVVGGAVVGGAVVGGAVVGGALVGGALVGGALVGGVVVGGALGVFDEDGVETVVTASVAGWSPLFSRLAHDQATLLAVVVTKVYVPDPPTALVTSTVAQLARDTGPVCPTGTWLTSGNGALSQVIPSSVQSLDAVHNDAPSALSLPAQHRNSARTTVAPDGTATWNLKNPYRSGWSSARIHGADPKLSLGLFADTHASAPTAVETVESPGVWAEATIVTADPAASTTAAAVSSETR
jgi:hypothetical protein